MPRHTALLDFARSLAGADSSNEVARRLAEAAPQLVDCDRVAVFLRQEGTDRLLCKATHGYPPALDAQMRGLRLSRGDTDPEMAEELFHATHGACPVLRAADSSRRSCRR